MPLVTPADSSSPKNIDKFSRQTVNRVRVRTHACVPIAETANEVPGSGQLAELQVQTIQPYVELHFHGMNLNFTGTMECTRAKSRCWKAFGAMPASDRTSPIGLRIRCNSSGHPCSEALASKFFGGGS